MEGLILVPCGVVLWRYDQTTTLLGPFVDRLDDINHLLLVVEDPVDLVIVAGAKVAHHVLVAKEEHDGHGVVELVHLVEVGDLVQVAYVDHSKVAHLVCDAEEHLVLRHALRVCVAPKPDHHQAVLFRQDGLVDVPTTVEMRQEDRPHSSPSPSLAQIAT